MLLIAWVMTCLSYLSLTGYLIYGYRHSQQPRLALVMMLALIVIVAQGYLLHHWIDLIDLQNLSVINVLGSVIWLSLVLITLANIWQPVSSLLLVVAPMGLVLTLLGWFDNGLLLVNTTANSALFWHVILAIITIAALAAASLQALFMYFHHQILKAKKHMRWLNFFPSLEAQGQLLLGFIALGFGLLTLVVGYGGVLLWRQPSAFTYLAPKMILALVSWLVLAILLGMGWLRPWQRLRLVPGTLLGFVVLLFAYLAGGQWLAFHQI